MTKEEIHIRPTYNDKRPIYDPHVMTRDLTKSSCANEHNTPREPKERVRMVER